MSGRTPWRRVVVVLAQRRLKPLCGSITKISNCAARERSEFGAAREFVFAEVSPEIFRDAFLTRLDGARAFDDRFVIAAADNHVRRGAEKRILGYDFAARH